MTVNVLAATLDARATVTRATKLRMVVMLEELSCREPEANACLPNVSPLVERFYAVPANLLRARPCVAEHGGSGPVRMVHIAPRSVERTSPVLHVSIARAMRDRMLRK